MGSGFSRKFCPVLKIEGNFSRLRAKPAHFVGHLPIGATRLTLPAGGLRLRVMLASSPRLALPLG